MDKAKLFANAEKAALKGNVDKAIDAFEEILRADSKDVKALNKVSDLYLKSGDAAKAIDSLKRVGAIYNKDGFYSKAIAIYKRVLKLDESSSKTETIGTHQKLAALYAQLGLVSDAMTHYKIVVDFFDQDNDREALLDVLRQVSDLDPNNIESQIKLTELFVAEGRKEDAVETMTRLTDNLRTKGSVADLVRVYEKWLDLFPEDFDVLQKLVDAYTKAGEPKKCLFRLQKAFRANPYNADVLELLSKTFTLMKQPEKARAVDVELIKIYRKENNQEKVEELEGRVKGGPPETPTGATSQPSVRRQSGSTANADDSIDPADSLISKMTLAPDEKKILSECEVYLKYGLAEKAREVLSGQMQKFAQSLALRWRLKSVLQELKQTDEVIQALSEIVLLAKDQKNETWLQLASDELKQLDSRHASLEEIPMDVGQVSAPQEKVSSKDDEPSDLGVTGATDTIAESFDESEISIIVEEDDFISDIRSKEDEGSSADADDSVVDLGNELELVEEEPLELQLESSEEPVPANEIGADDLEEFLSQSAEPESPPVTESKAEEKVEEQEAEGEEFLLSEDDFSADELAMLGDQLSPDGATDKPVDEPELMLEEPAPEDELVLEPAASDAVAAEPGDDVIDLSQELVLEEVDVVSESPSADSGEVLGDQEFEIKQSLEEIVFFRSQGLDDEAASILDGLRLKHPQRDFEAELASIEASSSSSAPIEHIEPITDEKSVELNAQGVNLEALGTKMKLTVQEDDRNEEEGDFFDLAGELNDEFDSPEETKKASVPAEVKDVFNAFKEGVAQSVSADDFQTHYDLGVAYREMGLLDDAIKEFELCAQIEDRKATSYYQIGVSEIQRENFDEAKKAFSQALNSDQIDQNEKISISYELGEVLMKLEDKEKAKELFEEVHKSDPDYREVQERLSSLG